MEDGLLFLYGYRRTQALDTVLDVKKMNEQGLTVIQDNSRHVTVRPATDQELKDWAATKGTGVTHKHTKTMHDAVVAEGKVDGCS